MLWIRRSNLGRRMLAVRSNERAAAAAGVSVPMTKMAAFAIAAFIAGIGGALFSYASRASTRLFFSSINSLILIAVAYLGGISMVEGSPISGALFQAGLFATFLSAIVHVNPEYAVYIGGVGLIFASINNPEGIAGSIRDARERIQRRRQHQAPRAGPTPPRSPRSPSPSGRRPDGAARGPATSPCASGARPPSTASTSSVGGGPARGPHRPERRREDDDRRRRSPASSPARGP